MSVAAVFQIGSLGDSIVSIPALLSIKELLPDCNDYLLVSRFDSALKVAPSHVFDMAWKPKLQINYKGPNRGLKQLFSIASLVRQLRYYRPRYCVYLMHSARSQEQVERDRLFFKMGGIKELIGFRALNSDELAQNPNGNSKGTEAYLRFRRIWNEAADGAFPRYSAVPSLKPSEEANGRVAGWLLCKRRYPDRKLVAFCPYSNMPSKDIPDQTLADLLPRLQDLGLCEVLLLGGKKDFERAQNLTRLAGVGINACGSFSLQESTAALSRCSLAICADSGPMHLAGAVGIPSLVTFSRMNTELGQWFPLGQRHTILYREVDCAGCRSIICPLPGHPCMRDITADQILSVALSKLNGLPLAVGSLGNTKIAGCEPRRKQ